MDNAHLRINPFQNIRVSRGIKDVYTITEEEFERIRNTRFSPGIQHTADMFIFSCGSGTSYCDTYALKPSDFTEKNGKLCIFKPRQKTKIMFYSVLLPWAKEIAEKYDYDFTKLKISNQKVNSALKKIGKICNLSIKPHYHLARHFYATYLINHKVPISSISKAMGHVNNSAVTLHYSRLLTDTIVEDIGNIF